MFGVGLTFDEMNYMHIFGISTITQKSYLFYRLNQWDRFKHSQLVEHVVKNITYSVFIKIFNRKNQVGVSAICWLKYTLTLISCEHIIQVHNQSMKMYQLLCYMKVHDIVSNINIVSMLYCCNIFKSDRYGIGKDSYIYCIDFHLDYLQLKFVSICVSIFSSILLVSIWNIFELINSHCQYYKCFCGRRNQIGLK